MAHNKPINLNTAFVAAVKGDVETDGQLVEGSVEWWDGRDVRVSNGVLRFVPSDNYASSFGFQWKRFRETQVDSKAKLTISRDRVVQCTKWTASDLSGKSVLEAGCGAGRFTEVLLQMGADVFAIDLSEAVDVAYANNGPTTHAVFAQASILDAPVPRDAFDFVFCYGVIQHTPEPEMAFRSLVEHLKPGGRISVDVYRKDRRIDPWKAKYLWRWLTTRMPAPLLYVIVWVYVPLWLPFDTLLRRVPVVGKYLASVIPCFNWFNPRKPTWEGVERTVLDTFDALSAKYDLPQTHETAARWCRECGLVDVDIFEGANGLVINARKPEARPTMRLPHEQS